MKRTTISMQYMHLRFYMHFKHGFPPNISQCISRNWIDPNKYAQGLGKSFKAKQVISVDQQGDMVTVNYSFP